MGTPRTQNRETPPERRFREDGEDAAEAPLEIGIAVEVPLEVNTTEERGGDPYNHTGRFKRIFR